MRLAAPWYSTAAARSATLDYVSHVSVPTVALVPLPALSQVQQVLHAFVKKRSNERVQASLFSMSEQMGITTFFFTYFRAAPPTRAVRLRWTEGGGVKKRKNIQVSKQIIQGK